MPLPNCPGVEILSVGTLETRDATVSGTLSLRQVQFTDDLITKMYLWSTTYGIGISTNQLNFFFPATAATVFQCNAVEKARIDTSGLDVTGKITVNSLPIYPLISAIYALGSPAVSVKDYTFPTDARRVTISWSNLQNSSSTYMVRLILYAGATAINATCMYQNFSVSTYSTTVIQLWQGALTTWPSTYWFNGHVQLTRVGAVGSVVQWSVSGLNGAYNGASANICMTSGEFSTSLAFGTVRIQGGTTFDLSSYVALSYE